MYLRDFIPPILIERLRQVRPARNKLFNSYESALAECKRGYEEDSLVMVVYEKTKIYRDALLSGKPLLSDIRSLSTFAGLNLAISGSDLNVIDFGGACGAHYFFSKALLGSRVGLHWHVVETTAMVNAARSLEDGQLKFYDDLEKAKNALGRVDIVFTSSTLQYVPRPYETLQRLTECGAAHIFITRVGLSTLPGDMIIIQAANLSANGPGPMPAGMKDGVIKYPVTFARKDKFEEIISRNYQIKIMLNEDKRVYAAGKHSIDLYGYFGSLKGTGA